MQPRRPHPPGHLTRREFHRLTAGGLLSLAAPGCAAAGAAADRARALAYSGAAGEGVALAAVPRGAAREATRSAVRAAALAATDFKWLSRGDTVVIKPVCNSGNAYPATTDPEAVYAMAGLLREKGAGRVVVADMSGVQFVRFYKDGLSGSTRRLMQGNGLAAAAEEAGAVVHAFEEQGWDAFYEDRPLAGGHWSDPVMMPSLLRQADHIVLMPRCARHLLAGSTLGMKAAVGWWRHDSRLEYHRDAASLAEKTAEASTVSTLHAKQRLVLTSATKVLTTFGPDQGYVAEPETGLVFASSSLTAHDMVSLAWLLENRAAMPAAARQGVIDDPNTSEVVINVVNRVVARWLGGFGAAMGSQWLSRFDLEGIWDDRVLGRAFALGGGVPRLELVDSTPVPDPVRARIAAAVALPA